MSKAVQVYAGTVTDEQLEAIEREASAAGVPVEWFYLEGCRLALAVAVERRKRLTAERVQRRICEFHQQVDENMERVGAQYRKNLERRRLKPREARPLTAKEVWG